MSSHKVRRTAYLSHLSTAINKLNSAITEKASEETVTVYLEQVNLKYVRVETATDIIQEDMEDEDELTADIDKMNEVENVVTELRVRTKLYLEKAKPKVSEPKPEPPATAQNPIPIQQQQLSAKLPDAKLQEFHGDEESFPSFLDNFNALVDSNKLLPDVEKFAYLRSCVKVDVINHFPLTANNYKPALEKLKRTYGDTGLIASKHQNALLDMSKRKKPTNITELQDFFNFLETKMTCLEALERPVDTRDQMLITLIFRQLPKNLKKQIAKLGDHSTVPKVMDIISEHIKTSKRMKFREESDEDSDSDNDSKFYNKYQTPVNPQSHIQNNMEPNSSSASLPVVSNRKYTCAYCNQNHPALHCQNITNIEERKESLKKSNRCFNCLATNHRVNDCRSNWRCRHCQRKHHTSICSSNEQRRERPSDSVETRNTNTNYQGVTTGSSWEASKNVLLQMAQAKLKKPYGIQSITANIFFDIGSQWSYCTEELKRKLDLDVSHKDVIEVHTFGNVASKVSTSDVVTLDIVKNQFKKTITVHTSPSICNPLPTFNISNRKLKELHNVELAFPDVKYNGDHHIDLLIGADLYWEFMEADYITTSFGARAIKSKLGWILSGPISHNNSITSTAINIVNSKVLQTLDLDLVSPNKNWVHEVISKSQKPLLSSNLDPGYTKSTTNASKKLREPVPTRINAVVNTYEHKVQQLNPDSIEKVDDWFQYEGKISEAFCSDLSFFWNTEHIGILPEEDEPTILQLFLDKIKYQTATRRYEVEFPCKTNLLNNLPDNYHLCELRLSSLLKKLNKDENKQVLNAYQDIIYKQLQDGVIEEIQPNSTPKGIVHYLPHHCVIKTEKSTSKVRIVYDGSAKANRKSISLNQCLHAGPSLVNNMIAVLMQFRMYKIGIVADISKAFLQIQITEKDRDLTRFIWKHDGCSNNIMKTYRFTRVPFGLASSPFLLNATLKFHINTYKELYPELVRKLLQSFYVDDMVTGVDSKEEGINLIQQSYEIMNDASMVLSKWNTNSKPILKQSCPPVNENLAEDTCKILGLIWNTLSDEFIFDFQSLLIFYQKLQPSKRTILRVIQKIYDPLGLLTPYLITAKLILQTLCKAQITWDEELPQYQLEKWQTWIQDLYNIKKIAIPRCINSNNKSRKEIVGFCDASKHAYAAVIYLRCIDDKNNVTSNLIISKSRVSPMKSLSIPRLELLGAVLLVRLGSTVRNCLQLWDISNTTYFSDSMNVIYWIRGSKRWNTYVSKRLEEIYNLSSKSQWHYCPSQENPADYPTRGMDMKELLQSRKWFYGPAFISETNMIKEFTEVSTPSKECLAEELKISTTCVSIVPHSVSNIIELKKYSKYMKLLRVTAFTLMFIYLRIRKQKVTFLDMIERAEKLWILNEQKTHYPEVIDKVTGEISQRKRNPVKQLDLFIDSEGILRCSGRYKYTDITFKSRFPILLPKYSHLTSLIVQYKHVKVKHGGMKATLLELRDEFWIPQARKAVQIIINKCVVCRRINAKSYIAPNPPPLPPIRLSELPPFTHTGVDYAGPLYLKERGCQDSYKAYIALFTCASSRAIHLELVPSMSSPSFRNCLIRFVSIWGAPRYMISDNAKSFKKSAEDLNCIITRSPTQEYLEDNRIVWFFYLEKSPWWGGFIERLVSSVKSPLRKILYRTFLSYDDMSTLLKEIQSILNSRPITYIYNDDIEEPLTPSHLLIGKRSTQLPITGNVIDDNNAPNQYRRMLVNKFQTRWKKEYLSELQDYHINRQRSHNQDNCPNIGDVVIMKEDSPRTNWKLARVTNIFTGRDGKVRSIEVKKPNREITRRPPQLLIPLECNMSDPK